MDLRIRRIRADESANLKRMRLRALADAPYAFSQRVDDIAQRTDEEWAQAAELWALSPNSVTFFAEADEEIIGMVGAFIENDHAELVAMWTAPPARRSGVARQLIEAVAQWCVDAGTTDIRLGVAEGNEAAARLYRSSGFESMDELRPMDADPSRFELRLRRDLGRASGDLLPG